MKNNKKGISAIVATVLIILITVAAVTIIWAAIIPMIQDNLRGGTACLNVAEVQIKDRGFTCYNISSGNVSIQVGRGAGDFDLTDYKIFLYSGGNSINNVSLANEIDNTKIPGINEERVIVLNNVTHMNDFQDVSKIDTIEIAPIIGTGATEVECPVSSSLKTLRTC